MKQGEYYGYWVIGQTEDDFQTKCRKIHRKDTSGFRTVEEHIYYLQSELEKANKKFTKDRMWLEWAFLQIDSDAIRDYESYEKLEEHLVNTIFDKK